MSADLEKQLTELNRLFQAGELSEATYKATVAALTASLASSPDPTAEAHPRKGRIVKL